ncbi:MAG: hypothetical protein IKQ35_01635 [Bacilli bacterium]|nr:hypothetical protein [Bacilli bacterium]
MKSLQIVTPHQECIFNCPFCIAKAHSHNNKFINNYEINNDLWKNNLINVINTNNDLKYVVITGTNEPMQSKSCVQDIIDIVRNTKKDIQIEIQTRMHKEDDIYKSVDVTCYSISNFNLIKNINPIGNTIRYVFILTESFNNKRLTDYLDIIPEEVTQLTFKTLENSNGVNIELDNWINNHKVDEDTLKALEKDINNYCGKLSIRLDKSCMDAEGRYKVFREDGNLYDDWG